MEKEEIVEVVDNPGDGKTFKEYPSIENHYRDNFIKGVRELGFDKPDIIWVASQKIHGSNFSVHCYGDYAKYGRRTDFLTKQIPIPCNKVGEYFTQAFYDARTLADKFHNNLKPVYDQIKAVYPNMTRYIAYGEYFGGNWPQKHPDYAKGAKAVQKGICYTPNHQFMVFDLFIVTQDSAFWADVLDLPKLIGDKLKLVPIYAKGNFDDMLGIDIKIDSTIPQILGLAKLQKNLIEGMVIRPNKSFKNAHSERVIIKKKNAEFSEVATGPKDKKQKTQKVEKPIDPQIAPFIQELSKYLNANRIQSVISKFPDLKDRNKLKQEIIKDIIKDAIKDGYKQPQPQLEKKVDTEFSKIVMKQLGEYYKKK